MTLMDIKNNKLAYATMGIGGSILVYVLYRKLKGSSWGESKTKLKGDVKITEISLEDTANPNARMPALALTFDPSESYYTYYRVNYTPRLEDGQLSNVDYELLQEAEIIPKGFPIQQTAVVHSHNNKNTFVVGYSKPFFISTNRDDLEVITPLWGVSVENNFDSDSKPPEDFPDEELFYDVGLRTLFAEWMLTNRGDNGCHPNQSLSDCNAERAAMLYAIYIRTRRKQQVFSDPSLTYESVIYGPGIKWNGGSQFMNTWGGNITQLARDRFETFYQSRFWHMPALAADAMSFIHYKSMSKNKALNPAWIKEAHPLDSNAQSYPSNYPIKMGLSVFIDLQKRFK